MEAPRLVRMLAGPNGGNCGNGDCPNISLTERGTVAVQGAISALPAPDNESVVEISQELLLEAARALSGR
jgi:hypothetical protein